MLSTKPTWTSINFVQAAALSLATFNEAKKSSYSANASSEFVHTSPDGPIMRLAYDHKASMMALDAFIPEDHDLTIGRVLGVTESGSVDKRTIWSSAADEDSLTAFESTFHLLLDKNNEDMLECGNTYEFYWKVDNATSKSNAGSWKQTIDCPSKVSGNKTNGAPAKTFAVTTSETTVESIESENLHPFAQEATRSLTTSPYTFSSEMVNPRMCNGTCTFLYYEGQFSCTNSTTSIDPVHWTLTCTPSTTSSGWKSTYQSCQTSMDGSFSSGQDWITPCTRSNTNVFDTKVFNNTSYSVDTGTFSCTFCTTTVVTCTSSSCCANVYTCSVVTATCPTNKMGSTPQTTSVCCTISNSCSSSCTVNNWTFSATQPTTCPCTDCITTITTCTSMGITCCAKKYSCSISTNTCPISARGTVATDSECCSTGQMCTYSTCSVSAWSFSFTIPSPCLCSSCTFTSGVTCSTSSIISSCKMYKYSCGVTFTGTCPSGEKTKIDTATCNTQITCNNNCNRSSWTFDGSTTTSACSCPTGDCSSTPVSCTTTTGGNYECCARKITCSVTYTRGFSSSTWECPTSKYRSSTSTNCCNTSTYCESTTGGSPSTPQCSTMSWTLNGVTNASTNCTPCSTCFTYKTTTDTTTICVKKYTCTTSSCPSGGWTDSSSTVSSKCCYFYTTCSSSCVAGSFTINFSFTAGKHTVSTSKCECTDCSYTSVTCSTSITTSCFAYSKTCSVTYTGSCPSARESTKNTNTCKTKTTCSSTCTSTSNGWTYNKVAPGISNCPCSGSSGCSTTTIQTLANNSATICVKKVKCNEKDWGSSCTGTLIYSTVSSNCCRTSTACGTITCVAGAWTKTSSVVSVCDCPSSTNTKCTMASYVSCSTSTTTTCYAKKGGYCTKTTPKNSGTCSGIYSSATATASCKTTTTCVDECNSTDWTFSGDTGTIDTANTNTTLRVFNCPCDTINSGTDKSNCISTYVTCDSNGSVNGGKKCVAKFYYCDRTIESKSPSNNNACTGSKSGTASNTCSVADACETNSCNTYTVWSYSDTLVTTGCDCTASGCPTTAVQVTQTNNSEVTQICLYTFNCSITGYSANNPCPTDKAFNASSLSSAAACCNTNTICNGHSKCVVSTFISTGVALSTTSCTCPTTGSVTCPTNIVYTKNTAASVCIKSIQCNKTGYLSGNCPTTAQVGADPSPHCCTVAGTGTKAVCPTVGTCDTTNFTTGMSLKPSSGCPCTTCTYETTTTATGSYDVCFKKMSCTKTYTGTCLSTYLTTKSKNCCNESLSCSQGGTTTCNTSNWNSMGADYATTCPCTTAGCIVTVITTQGNSFCAKTVICSVTTGSSGGKYTGGSCPTNNYKSSSRTNCCNVNTTCNNSCNSTSWTLNMSGAPNEGCSCSTCTYSDTITTPSNSRVCWYKYSCAVTKSSTNCATTYRATLDQNCCATASSCITFGGFESCTTSVWSENATQPSVCDCTVTSSCQSTVYTTNTAGSLCVKIISCSLTGYDQGTTNTCPSSLWTSSTSTICCNTMTTCSDSCTSSSSNSWTVGKSKSVDCPCPTGSTCITTLITQTVNGSVCAKKYSCSQTTSRQSCPTTAYTSSTGTPNCCHTNSVCSQQCKTSIWTYSMTIGTCTLPTCSGDPYTTSMSTTSASQVNFYWLGTKVEKTNITSWNTVSFNTFTGMKYVRTCQTSDFSTNWYIYPCHVSNTTAWDSTYLYYADYSTDISYYSYSIEWSRYKYWGSRLLISATDPDYRNNTFTYTYTDETRSCEISMKGKQTSQYIDWTSCKTSLMCDTTQKSVWTRDQFTVTDYSVSTVVNTTSTTTTSYKYIMKVFEVDRQSTSNATNYTSTRICNKDATASSQTNYLTTGGSCPTTASTNPFTVDSWTTTTSTTYPSGSYVFFITTTNTYSRTMNSIYTSTSSIRTCNTSDLGRNLYIQPCSTGNTTAWDSTFTGKLDSTVEGTTCTMYTFNYMLMSGNRVTTTSGNTVTGLTATTSISWTCMTSTVMTGMYVYDCSLSNTTAFDSTFSFSFTTVSLLTGTTTTTSTSTNTADTYAFIQMTVTGVRSFPTSSTSWSNSSFSAFTSSVSSTIRTCVTSNVATNLYISPCSEYNTTAWNDSVTSFYYSYSTNVSTTTYSTSSVTTVKSKIITFITADTTKMTWERKTITGTRSGSSSWSTISSGSSTRTCKSTYSSSSPDQYYIIPCTTGNTTAWVDSFVYVVQTATLTTSATQVYFSSKRYFGNRTVPSTSTSSTETTSCVVPSTGSTGTFSNGFTYGTSSCTTGNTDAYKYYTSWGTGTFCNIKDCYFYKFVSLCQSYENCSYTSMTVRSCNIADPQQNMYISPCSSSNTTVWDTTVTGIRTTNYVAATTTTSSSSASSVIEFKAYTKSLIRPDMTSTTSATTNTTTRSCMTSSTTNFPYNMTACSTGQKTALFSTDYWSILDNTVGSCKLTTTASTSGTISSLVGSGSSTIMYCSFDFAKVIYSKTSSTVYTSFPMSKVSCLTTMTTSDFNAMTTCRPEAVLTMTYDFTTTEISCAPGSITSKYITTTTSGAKTTTTYTYTSCTVQYKGYTSCVVASPSNCVASALYTSVQCNSFDYSECTSSLAFKALWIDTAMDHTRCNFPTTVNSTSTDSGSTICCYWNGDYQKLISTTSIASMYLSSFTSTSITGAKCTISTVSGSSITCVQATTTSVTSSSPSVVFWTCASTGTYIEPCTTLKASCNSEVFTSSTSICCYYDFTVTQYSANSSATVPTTDRCCQIEFSLTFTTISIVSSFNSTTTKNTSSSVTVTNTNIVSTYTTSTTNTYTYTTSNCCRTNTYTCTSSDTSSTCTALLASSITSYTELTCDDTCISTCFLGMCWSQCSTYLDDSCINVAYQSLTTATMTMCGTAWVDSVTDSTYTTTVVDCTSETICMYIWPVDEAVCGCTGTCSSETCSTVTFSFGQWKDCYTTCSSGGGSTDDSKDEIKLNIFADADNVGEALEQGVRNLYIAFTGSWINLD